MASTPPGAEQIRYFLYAQVCGVFFTILLYNRWLEHNKCVCLIFQSDCYILCEVSLDGTTMNMKSTIKMEDPANVHSFIEVFQNCLVDVTTTS